ncbi:MAG: hypothetical protein LBR78_02365 [Holosporales bacterium]|jgi:hypothetical protein|nr:hypothetical protein [Holosporales bacterium]
MGTRISGQVIMALAVIMVGTVEASRRAPTPQGIDIARCWQDAEPLSNGDKSVYTKDGIDIGLVVDVVGHVGSRLTVSGNELAMTNLQAALHASGVLPTFMVDTQVMGQLAEIDVGNPLVLVALDILNDDKGKRQTCGWLAEQLIERVNGINTASQSEPIYKAGGAARLTTSIETLNKLLGEHKVAGLGYNGQTLSSLWELVDLSANARKQGRSETAKLVHKWRKVKVSIAGAFKALVDIAEAMRAARRNDVRSTDYPDVLNVRIGADDRDLLEARRRLYDIRGAALQIFLQTCAGENVVKREAENRFHAAIVYIICNMERDTAIKIAGMEEVIDAAAELATYIITMLARNGFRELPQADDRGLLQDIQAMVKAAYGNKRLVQPNVKAKVVESWDATYEKNRRAVAKSAAYNYMGLQPATLYTAARTAAGQLRLVDPLTYQVGRPTLEQSPYATVMYHMVLYPQIPQANIVREVLSRAIKESTEPDVLARQMQDANDRQGVPLYEKETGSIKNPIERELTRAYIVATEGMNWATMVATVGSERARLRQRFIGGKEAALPPLPVTSALDMDMTATEKDAYGEDPDSMMKTLDVLKTMAKPWQEDMVHLSPLTAGDIAKITGGALPPPVDDSDEDPAPRRKSTKKVVDSDDDSNDVPPAKATKPAPRSTASKGLPPPVDDSDDDPAPRKSAVKASSSAHDEKIVTPQIKRFVMQIGGISSTRPQIAVWLWQGLDSAGKKKVTVPAGITGDHIVDRLVTEYGHERAVQICIRLAAGLGAIESIDQARQLVAQTVANPRLVDAQSLAGIKLNKLAANPFLGTRGMGQNEYEAYISKNSSNIAQAAGAIAYLAGRDAEGTEKKPEDVIAEEYKVVAGVLKVPADAQVSTKPADLVKMLVRLANNKAKSVVEDIKTVRMRTHVPTLHQFVDEIVRVHTAALTEETDPLKVYAATVATRKSSDSSEDHEE